jgi:hypothetical protein
MNINEWAVSRETSIEVVEAIFELAQGDENKAQQIWEDGDDRIIDIAFSKTEEDEPYWGEETISRS